MRTRWLVWAALTLFFAASAPLAAAYDLNRSIVRVRSGLVGWNTINTACALVGCQDRHDAAHRAALGGAREHDDRTPASAARCTANEVHLPANARVKVRTDRVGVDATLECVGTVQAFTTAVSVTRPGGTVGYVGVPHGVEVPIGTTFFRNIGLRGGAAPVRTYIPELLHDVLQGRIDPGRVFDFETDLDGIAAAYAAMDERRAVKSLVHIGTV